MIKWALDKETWRFDAGYRAPHPVSTAFCDVAHPAQTELRLWSDPLLYKELKEVLKDGIVGVNIAYDMGVMLQWYPSLRPDVWRAYAEGKIVDVAIASMLQDVAKDTVQHEYSLEAMAKRHLGVDVAGKHGEDAWRLRYRELTDVPVADWPVAAESYARLDPTYTAQLWNKIGPQPCLAFECQAAFALHLSAAWGMRTDGAKVAVLDQNLTEIMARRDKILIEHGILRPDGTKDKGRIEALVLADLGKKALKTPSGKIQCDKDALKLCEHPALVALEESGSFATVRSTFLPIIKAGVDWPINPKYNPVMRTDRVSCEKPNLENLPRVGGVRECLIPRKGRVFAAVDYSGAELVCLAQILEILFPVSQGYAPCVMAETIRKGQDLHIKTAAMLLGRTYEATLLAYKAGENQVVEVRQLSKIINFGLPGGMVAATLRRHLRRFGIECSEAQAKDYRNRWLALYPEMERYFALLKASCGRGTITITHPLTGFVRGGISYTQGCNHYFQSLLAKIAKQALWDSAQEMYGLTTTALTGSRLAVFVHDELIIESPVDVAPEAAERLGAVMVAAGAKWLPTLALSADPHLMTCWSKKAKAIRDINGRLVPWSPVALAA